MLSDNVAVADTPIVLKTHETNAAFARERRGLGQRELALRFDQVRLIDAAHGLGVAATRGFASEFRCAQRLHVNVADAGFRQACGEHVLGEARTAGIGDLAHVHERFHFRGFQRLNEIRNTDAFVADGPDAAHCR
jgi:hypothetical protein